MFHSFDYPDETGLDELAARFWNAIMKKGILEFPRPAECKRRFIREMKRKEFGLASNLNPIEREEALL
jgi:CRISPR-associated protein Cas5d